MEEMSWMAEGNALQSQGEKVRGKGNEGNRLSE